MMAAGDENAVLSALDEETREYIHGILDDSTMELSEQREFIREFLEQLESATDIGDIEQLLDLLFQHHDAKKAVEIQQKQQECEQALQKAIGTCTLQSVNVDN
jgi:hypothetical protein